MNAGLYGDDLRPITLSGTGLWYSERTDVPTGAEMTLGNGLAVFDQVRATERMEHEPRAAEYLARLLNFMFG